MNIADKKQSILNVIYERAYKLEEKAIEFLSITSKPENIDYEAIKSSALKKAFQEFKENKPVFNKPSFL